MVSTFDGADLVMAEATSE